MYKPHTVEQYKIVKYLKEDQHFAMEHFSSPPYPARRCCWKTAQGHSWLFPILRAA